jgi:hypothetical protein
LVLEGEPGASADVEAELNAAGHEVARCHEGGTTPFPCHGMVDGVVCPLETDLISVAVLCSGGGGQWPAPGGGDDGARCALRRHIPLVVVGEPATSVYRDWAAAEASDGDIVPTVERTAVSPLRRHTEAARRSLRSVLAMHDLPTEQAGASVTRAGSDLKVILEPGIVIPASVAEMAAVRVLGAVRDIDPYPPSIGVSVDQPSANGAAVLA